MRVLLSGYYGLGNLGDEAILAGLAGALAVRGHVPVALSGDPTATEELHGIEARHRTRGLLRAIASTDAVVSGGGGLLQDVTSARSLAYYLWVLRLARWRGRPVAVYGQSLGPLGTRGRSRLARALRGVPLFLRDDGSVSLAAELGLQARLVADAALLLAEPGNPWLAERGADDGHVVLVPRGGHDAYNEVLGRLARALVATGERVAVVAFHPALDDAPCAQLLRLVPEVEPLSAPTPLTAVTLLAKASYVVSARLHGCILAAVAGVGFAGLSYDPKVAGFLDQVRAPVFRAPVDEHELLRAVAARERADDAAIAELIASAHAGVDSLFSSLAAQEVFVGRR